MTKNWFCQITAGNRGFICNSAQEHRYREALFRIAKKENADIPEYICREGKILFIICCENKEIVNKIIKFTNASYGKHIKMMGHRVIFDAKKPELIQKIHDYARIREKYFCAFYVAEEIV